jgi:hypothetical protein
VNVAYGLFGDAYLEWHRDKLWCAFCRTEHSFSNLFGGCEVVRTEDGEVGGVRLEPCLLICEFVVDRALDLAGLLQELHTERWPT